MPNVKVLIDMDDESNAVCFALINVVNKIKEVFPAFLPHKYIVEYLCVINKEPSFFDENNPVGTDNIDSFPPFNIMAMHFSRKQIFPNFFKVYVIVHYLPR